MMQKLMLIPIVWLLLSLNLHVPTALAGLQAEDLRKSENSPELIEATNLSVQVVKFYKERKFDEALPLAKRAVELREKTLGREHTLVAEALTNLASLYIGKHKLGDAESLFQRVLGIYEKTEGAASPKLCDILENLGWLKFATRDYQKAEDFIERSLAIKEKTFGEHSQEVSKLLVYLGQMKQRLRRYAEAALFYQRAFEAREKVSGADKKELADLAQKCSCALKLNKQHKESEEYAQRARDIAHPEGASANVVRQKSSVLAGSATHREEPEYPLEAKRAAVSGTVLVEVTVDETGKVIASRVICGDDLLSYSAEQAARKWRFTPTLLSGAPVKVMGTITFNFNL